MSALTTELRHLRDAAALLRAGLPPTSRIVTPRVPDHRYQMVLSRYLFACRFSQGVSVLDFGSGSGFGAQPLLSAGATRYVGLEEEYAAYQHAKKRYGSERVQFRHGPLSAPGGDLDHHGLVLALDLLARYTQPESLLHRIAGHVEELDNQAGRLVVGVPLVAGAVDVELAHQAGAATALTCVRWSELLRQLFHEVRSFRHCAPLDTVLDWREPSPSSFAATDFRFEEEETAVALTEHPGLSAFFVCSRRKIS